jgi:hypothetical protein
MCLLVWQDFAGDLGMGSHRFNADRVAYEIEIIQQAADGFFLLAFLADEFLGEYNAALPRHGCLTGACC